MEPATGGAPATGSSEEQTGARSRATLSEADVCGALATQAETKAESIEHQKERTAEKLS